jgi:2-dehydro-3-deoxy-D-arabinonate dehydratase
MVTADEIKDPYALEMTCTIERAGKMIFSGAVSTSKLGRKIENLVEYLLRANPVPAASVMLTGTGIIVKQDAALQPGDVVTIRVPEIGALQNTAGIVQ